MNQKVVKELNKLADALGLCRGERERLKDNWAKTPNRSLKDLKDRVKKVLEHTGEIDGKES